MAACDLENRSRWPNFELGLDFYNIDLYLKFGEPSSIGFEDIVYTRLYIHKNTKWPPVTLKIGQGDPISNLTLDFYNIDLYLKFSDPTCIGL